MMIEVNAAKVNEWLLKAAQRYVRIFEDHVISVTEATFPCLRAAYYNRVRKQLPTPVEALKVLGSEVHSLIQEELRHEGWDVEVSVGLDLGEFKLVGRADAVKYDGRNNALAVIELKTSNGVHEKPLSSHRLQLQTYLEILHAKIGYLVYIDRASGRVKVFRVLPDKRALSLVVDRAKLLYNALRQHQPPPKTSGPWCGVCPHKRYCFKRW